MLHPTRLAVTKYMYLSTYFQLLFQLQGIFLCMHSETTASLAGHNGGACAPRAQENMEVDVAPLETLTTTESYFHSNAKCGQQKFTESLPYNLKSNATYL